MTEQPSDGTPTPPAGPPAAFPPPQVHGTPPQPYGAPPPQPYGAPPAQPYGAPPQPQPQPAAYSGFTGYGPRYGTAPYGAYGQPPGYGTPPYGGYPQPAPTPGATIALVVVSAFFVFAGLLGVPSLVIGIVALTRAKTNPEETNRLTWIGWLVLGILVLLATIIVVILVAVAVSSSSSDDGTVSTLGVLGTTARAMVLRST